MRRFNSRLTARFAAVTALSGLAIFASACGSSNDNLGKKKLSPASIRTLIGYTDGKAGPANSKLSPVEVGFFNQEGGASNFAYFHSQTKAMVNLVNSQLGGIHGHPLKTVDCVVVSSDEEGQACGERFANDKALKAVMEFSLSNGQAAFHQTLAKSGRDIPIIGPLPTSPADAADPNGFYTTSGVFGTIPSYVKFIKQTLHGKEVALISVSGEATSTSVARLMKQGFNNAGMKVTQSTLKLGDTDLSGPLAASAAKTADVIVPLVLSPPQCLGVAKSLQQAGLQNKPVLALYGCVTQTLRTQLGGDWPKWYYGAQYTSELAPPTTERQKAAIRALADWYAPLRAAGTTETAQPGFASGATTMQTVVTMVRHLNVAGPDATPKQVGQVAKSWKGPIMFGPDVVKYGDSLTLPALPTLGITFYKYNGNDHWANEDDGKFVVGDF